MSSQMNIPSVMVTSDSSENLNYHYSKFYIDIDSTSQTHSGASSLIGSETSTPLSCSPIKGSFISEYFKEPTSLTEEDLEKSEVADLSPSLRRRSGSIGTRPSRLALASTTRLCASHEHIVHSGPPPPAVPLKKKLRQKISQVFRGSNRKRSTSTSQEESSQQSNRSRLKAIFSRRSRSQNDVSAQPPSSPRSSGTTSPGEDPNQEAQPDADEDLEGVSPAAINQALVARVSWYVNLTPKEKEEFNRNAAKKGSRKRASKMGSLSPRRYLVLDNQTGETSTDKVESYRSLSESEMEAHDGAVISNGIFPHIGNEFGENDAFEECSLPIHAKNPDQLEFLGYSAVENYYSPEYYPEEVLLDEDHRSVDCRGKSRSMEHAFDFESFRRKIGERTTSEPTREMPPCSPADPSEIGRDNTTAEGKRGSPRTMLSGPTISYTVQANDTLTSIAARFDTTPSELTKMNRLSTRFLFPGQILIVPDKGGAKENLQSATEEKDILKDLQTSPLLSDLGLPVSPYTAGLPRTPANSVDTDRSLDRDCLEKFLKIQVRHITDGQGVVAGVLLVTPNAVMFDPNVSDPLVIERGSESYGVIAPMDFVVNAALYYDIAHMKVKDTGLPSDSSHDDLSCRPEIPKPEIYYGPFQSRQESEENIDCPDLLQVGDQSGSQESPSKDLSLSKDTTFPELAASSQDNDNDSSCSCGGETRETSAFPKAFEHEILTPISSDTSPTGGEGQETSPAPPPLGPSTVLGDLTPIAETPKPDESNPDPTRSPPSGPAQAECDTSSKNAAQSMVVNDDTDSVGSIPSLSTTNDKKRTTSVTFSTSSESDMPTVPEDGTDQPSQESRKQKVLKRLSYPLSWMESFSTDKDNQPVSQHQQAHTQHSMPSSAPPVSMGSTGGTTSMMNPEASEANKHGMFSNVFSMSNVSNMLTRRPSLDFARRPASAESVPPQSTVNFNTHQAQKRAQFKEGPKFGLKSMVSVDDRPDLFANFEKLIPKPASCCDDPPLYLCLRMGKPADKPIPKSTPIMTYGKKTMRAEYWFSIPRNRTDELYNFFQIWASDIYGELDEEAVKLRGFILIEEETKIWPDDKNQDWEDLGTLGAGELKEITKESWEVVAMSEELRRALYSSSSLSSLDIEVFLPEVQGPTEIIDDTFRKNMYRKLPARVQGHNWKLVFSTSQHGFSLKALYRKMAEIESPIIIYIQDTNQNKFGALLSCPLRVSELFYGTGECFLFVCQPEFQIFPWTGDNTFFVKGNNESLFIGGGDGNFGIWLDGDLYQGRSQPCKTFGNPILSGGEDFIVKTVECWHFN